MKNNFWTKIPQNGHCELLKKIMFFFFFFSGMFKTRWFVTPVILFTLIYNIPKFFELELVYPPDEIICQSNSTQCSSEKLENFVDQVELKPTEMRINKVNLHT